MNLPEISVRRPVFTLMVYIGIVMVGVFTLVQTPIDLLPEIEIPAITVITTYDGAGPEEVEERISRPLERQLATVEDLSSIISISREGRSEIRLLFDWGANLDARANDIRDRIDMVQRMLPEDADRSRLLKLDLSQFPIQVYGVHASESYVDLEQILDDDVVSHMEGVSGVGALDVIVPIQRQINVDIDREQLIAHGLTLAEVAHAIAQANIQAAAGSLKMGDTDYLPRVIGEFDEVAPMRDIAVQTRADGVVRLMDIGAVTDGFKDVDLHVRINGRPGAILLVRKQADANTVQVARDIAAVLESVRGNLPPDVEIMTVMDSSEDIVLMVRDLARTLFVGGFMAMLVVFIFLRQVRSTFIIALTIPFSLIAAGVFMYFLDYSINMLTLFALIVCIGLVVDNGIVVLENITRHRETGENRREGAVYGTLEVSMAIIASSLTTLCIFFPLLFVRGMASVLFVPFAMVAAIVILASLFTALTMTPMLSSRLLPEDYAAAMQGRNVLFRWSERFFDGLSGAYSAVLGWSLRHRWLVILGTAVLLIISIRLIPLIGWELMPAEDTAMIQGEIRLPVGTRMERTAAALAAVHDIIQEEVREEEKMAAFIRAGGAGEAGPGGAGGPHVGYFGVRLVRQDQRERYITEIVDRLHARLEQIAPLYSIDEFRMDTQDMVSGIAAGGERPLTINILGDDLQAAETYAEQLKDRIAQLPGAVDLRTSMDEGTPEIQISPDRDKMAAMGVRVSHLADTLRAGIQGRTASRFRHLGEERDVFVRLREDDRQSPADLGMLPVRLPSGQLTRLENLGAVDFGVGPLVIERLNQRRVVRVEGNVRDRSIGELIRDVQEVLRELPPPPGLTIDIGGQFEDIQETFFWMAVALAIGIVLVYMVMASQFESLIDPFVVMFSIPVAFIGVIWGLFLRGFTVNMIVFLGLLLLIGIVVNNAIVLVDYINILRARGQDMHSAIREAGKARLRPVLMTAVTTIVALTPMAFHRGQGWEVWNPLGTTILSGLLVSTVVTLTIVPTMYSIFEARRNGNKQREAAA